MVAMKFAAKAVEFGYVGEALEEVEEGVWLDPAVETLPRKRTVLWSAAIRNVLGELKLIP